MRFNKLAFIPILIIISSATTNGTLINAPNPRLGFPSRTQSVANALYSAIELPLATFPNEKIKEEVKTLKTKIRVESHDQFLDLQPDVHVGYRVNVNQK